MEGPIPHFETVVTKHDALDLSQIPDGRPRELERLSRVVVSAHEMLFPVQAREDVGQTPLGELARECKISKMPDYIRWLDAGVPVVDERDIHVLGGHERARAIADDVRVAEMGVSGKECGHNSLFNRLWEKSIRGLAVQMNTMGCYLSRGQIIERGIHHKIDHGKMENFPPIFAGW